MNLYNSLLDALILEEIDTHTFIGKNVNIGSLNIYGGHVLSQSVIAATKCASEGKEIHSLHGYFLHPGDNDEDIRYEVEVIKEGRSFDVLRVKAIQKNKVIFITSSSFHLPEKGIEHQSAMPNVIEPSHLKPFSKIFADFSEKFGIQPRGIISEDGPFIWHPLEYYDPFNPGVRAPKQHLWYKPNGPLPESKVIQNSLLAYVSDFNLLITALLPHNLSFFTTPMKIASLDHAMWFHSSEIWHDWMLYEVESVRAHGGRAFCTGKIFTKDGLLVASVTQEGLIRSFK